MNWTKMAILGAFLLIIFAIPAVVNGDIRMKSEVLNSKYDEVMKNSVKDATGELVEVNNNNSSKLIAQGDELNYMNMDLNLDKALERFYKTLYLNLNIDNDYAAQQALMANLPVIVVTGYDGYYINTWESKQKWSGKTRYEKLDTRNNLKVGFTLDDKVFVTDLNTKVTIEGDRKEFNNKYPNSYFGSQFENVRNETVFEAVQNSIEYYGHASSQLAIKNGWKYKFKAPVVENRLINNISFIALLQGNGEDGTIKFNTYGFSVAKVVKKPKVYGFTKDGVNFYTDKKSKDCDRVFQNDMEAAKEGYRPYEL